MTEQPPQNDPLAALSKRERTIAERSAEGLTYREIGEALHIAPNTVRTHVATIYRKLAIQNKAALVRLWVQGQRDAGHPNGDAAPQAVTAERPFPDRSAGPELALVTDGASWQADLPAVAVLPFANLNCHPDQESLAQGIAEDIRTELSRLYWLSVTASGHVIVERRKRLSPRDIGRLLGTHYLLMGSVRQAAGRARFNAGLVECATSTYLWAEHYDLTCTVDSQDEVARTVASTVAGRVKMTERQRLARMPVKNFSAYDYALIGEHILPDAKEENQRSRLAFQRAIEMQPTIATAYAGLARTYVIDAIFEYDDDFEGLLDKALSLSSKAISVDMQNSKAEWVLGDALAVMREFGHAEKRFDRALAINPLDSDALAMKGMFFHKQGRYEESIALCRQALQTDQYHPIWHIPHLASSYYANKQYREALIPMKFFASSQPSCVAAQMGLAVTYAQLGQIKEAQSVAERVLTLAPQTSLRKEHARLSRRFDDAFVEHRLEGMRKAGIPD